MYSNSIKMKKKVLIFLCALLLIIGVVLVIHFTRKSETDETDETGGLPTVKDTGIKLVLNPGDTADKVEEYSILTTEYAFGETTAKNIDIKLTWTNGPAFATVGSLIFVHKANGQKVRENVITTDNTESNKSQELIFKGGELTSEDVIGDNTIDMYWNEVNESNNLTTLFFSITKEHLDTTLNLANASIVDIPVEISSASTSSGDVIATHTKYRIPPFFTDPVHIRKTDANDNKGFHAIKDNQKQVIDDVDTFYIVKALGKEFISKDASGNQILRGDTKKFASKNDIFGDNDIMNSSAITLVVHEQLTQIPHQINSGLDGSCWYDGKTVHQDIPGCGRICSSATHVGRKDKNSWGLWGDNQNDIDCPAAKLDQVWKLTGGSTNGRPNRALAVGALSSHPFGCNTFRIKSRWGFYLKDQQGDGALRADKRILGGETKGWTIEGTFPNNLRIKSPKGYYLKDMGSSGGATVRLDSRIIDGETTGWYLPHTHNLTNLNIKSPKNRYLCMNSNGNLYFHGGNIPDSNAWKIECD